MIKTCVFWIKVNNSTTLKNIFETNILGQKRRESIYEFGKANSYVFNKYFDDNKSFWVLAKDSNDVIELIKFLAQEFSTPILAFSENKYAIFNTIGNRINIESSFEKEYYLAASIIEENSGYYFDSDKFYSDNCNFHDDNKLDLTPNFDHDKEEANTKFNFDIKEQNNNNNNEIALKENIKNGLKDYESSEMYEVLSSDLDIDHDVPSSEENLFENINSIDLTNKVQNDIDYKQDKIISFKNEEINIFETNNLIQEESNKNSNEYEKDTVTQNEKIDWKSKINFHENNFNYFFSNANSNMQHKNDEIIEQFINEVPAEEGIEIVEDFSKFLNEESKEEFEYEIDIDKEIQGENFIWNDEDKLENNMIDESVDILKVLNFDEEISKYKEEVHSNELKESIKNISKLDEFDLNIDFSKTNEIIHNNDEIKNFFENLKPTKNVKKFNFDNSYEYFQNQSNEILETLGDKFSLKRKNKKITLDETFDNLDEYYKNEANEILETLDEKFIIKKQNKKITLDDNFDDHTFESDNKEKAIVALETQNKKILPNNKLELEDKLSKIFKKNNINSSKDNNAFFNLSELANIAKNKINKHIQNNNIESQINNESLYVKAIPYEIDINYNDDIQVNEFIDFEQIYNLYDKNTENESNNQNLEKINIEELNINQSINNPTIFENNPYDETEIRILNINDLESDLMNDDDLNRPLNGLNNNLMDEKIIDDLSDTIKIEIDNTNNVHSYFDSLENVEFIEKTEDGYDFNINGFDYKNLYNDNHLEDIQYNEIKNDIKDEYNEIQSKIEKISMDLVNEIDDKNIIQPYSNKELLRDELEDSYYGELDEKIIESNINQIEEENIEINESIDLNKSSIISDVKNFKELHDENKKLSSELNQFLSELAKEKELINNREEIIYKREKKLKEIMESDYAKKSKIPIKNRKWRNN